MSPRYRWCGHQWASEHILDQPRRFEQCSGDVNTYRATETDRNSVHRTCRSLAVPARVGRD